MLLWNNDYELKHLKGMIMSFIYELFTITAHGFIAYNKQQVVEERVAIKLDFKPKCGFSAENATN